VVATPSPLRGTPPIRGENFLSDRRGEPRSGGEVVKKILPQTSRGPPSGEGGKN